MKKLIINTIVLLGSHLLLSASWGATPQWCSSDKPVKIAAITWESGQFYGELASLLLRNGYNCKTEFVTGSTAVTEAALVSQDLQVWPEQWNRTEIIKKGIGAKKIELVGNILQGGTMEGWFVPEYVVKGDPERKIAAIAPDLKSISDLPKYKAIFADDEDSTKGRFLNCPTGWDCEMINSRKIKAYKLTDDYVNFRPGTGGALDATIASAFARGKPLLFYYWSPATLMGKYKMHKLEESAYSEACWKTLADKSNTNSACPSDSPHYQLSFGVSAGFKAEAPEVIELFSKLQLTPEMLNQVLAQASVKKVGADVMAREFVKNNRQLVNSWMTSEAVGNFNKNFK